MCDLVSVIVPMHNVESYIGRCLDSVLGQTYKNIEVIIVDDNSVDKSRKIVEQYEDQRIQLYSLEKRGVSAARNRGLDVCRGSLIMFLDSDDWLECDAIEKMVNKMLEDVDIVQASFRRVGDSYVRDVRLKDEIVKERLLYYFFKKEKIVHVVWNKLYRKSFLNDIKFVEGIIYEDEVFNFEIIEKKPIILNTEDIVYNYFQREGSIMHDIDLRQRMRVIETSDIIIEKCITIGSTYENLARYDKYINLLYLYSYAKNNVITYNDSDLLEVIRELKKEKKKIQITKLLGKVSEKTFFTVFIPALISLDFLPLLLRILLSLKGEK